MIEYVLRRVLWSIITVFFILTATFWALRMVPGSPLDGAKGTSPEIRANLNHKYGLDKPLWDQYVIYLELLAQGDFGISFREKSRSVNDIIRDHFPVSASLGIVALIIASLGGVLWGSIAALNRNRMPDYVLTFLVVLGVSVPGFVFAMLGQRVLTWLNADYGFNFFPVAGWGTWRHFILPAVVLGLGTMALLTRLMRSSMLEVVNTDYVRTARSKGVRGARLFFKHQLRNAVQPVITVLGPQIAAITTGGFVVELVFAIPGLGRSFVTSVQAADYTVVQGLTVFYGAFLVFMVLVVDIVYGLVDPRIRLS